MDHEHVAGVLKEHVGELSTVDDDKLFLACSIELGVVDIVNLLLWRVDIIVFVVGSVLHGLHGGRSSVYSFDLLKEWNIVKPVGRSLVAAVLISWCLAVRTFG